MTKMKENQFLQDQCVKFLQAIALSAVKAQTALQEKDGEEFYDLLSDIECDLISVRNTAPNDLLDISIEAVEKSITEFRKVSERKK